MRIIIGAILGMVTGVALFGTQLHSWWRHSFEYALGGPADVIFPVAGILLFRFSYRRFSRARNQQRLGQKIEAPKVTSKRFAVGKIFVWAGYFFLAISIVGGVWLAVVLRSDPEAGIAVVPLTLVLMFAGLLGGIGSALKNG